MAFGRTPNSIQTSFRQAMRPKPYAWGGGRGSSIQSGAQRALQPQAPVTTPVTAAAPQAQAAPAPPPVKTPDPRDSTYNTGVAGLLFNNKNQRDDLTTQGVHATTDFNTMLSRLADNRAQDLLAQNYAANKQGLFYSGQLGKRRDSVDKGYDQQQDDARTSYTRADEARTQALNRLGEFTPDANSPTGYTATGQAGVDLSGLLNQAILRQGSQDANGGGDLAAAAQTVAPAPESAAAPVAESVPTATSSGPQGSPVAIKIAPSASHGGAKWVYHRAASGQWIPIRPA